MIIPESRQKSLPELNRPGTETARPDEALRGTITGDGAVNNVTSFPSKTRPAARPETDLQGITRIHLFGEIRVIGPAGNNILPPSKKTKAVLAYLCLSRGERILRARLAGIIWDRSGEVQALDSLRHALHELNRAGATWKLERERHAVRLDTGACWIDAVEAPERAELLRD